MKKDWVFETSVEASTLPKDVPVNNDKFMDLFVFVLVDVGGYVVDVLHHFSTFYVSMEDWNTYFLP